MRRLGNPLTEEERKRRHEELHPGTPLPPRGTRVLQQFPLEEVKKVEISGPSSIRLDSEEVFLEPLSILIVKGAEGGEIVIDEGELVRASFSTRELVCQKTETPLGDIVTCSYPRGGGRR